MSKHIIMCRVCKEKFEAKPEEEGTFWFMKTKNQYYHCKCFSDWKENTIGNEPNNELWKDRIYAFISFDLKKNYDYFLIEQQLKKFIKNGNTYKGIYFALKYFYEIKNGDWEKSHNGIGIVPYIYAESSEYWVKLENQHKGLMENIEKQMIEREKQQVVLIEKPNHKKKKKTTWELEG